MQKLTFNSVNMGGNLSTPVQVRSTDGVDSATFDLAIEDGTRQKPHTTTITCVATGDTAITVNKWFVKGDRILVSGVLRTGILPGKGGERLHIVVARVHLLENPDRTQVAPARGRSGTRAGNGPVNLDTQDS